MRLSCIEVIVAVLLLGGSVVSALAQTYPAKPIRLVVPYAPGGAADPNARIVGLRLSEVIGQPVIVDNRPGAGGNIGTNIVAKAVADGYTVALVAASTVTINQSLYSQMQYDPIRDLAPVSLVSLDSIVLVATPTLPVNSVKDIIVLAKAKPGEVNYGSGGTGSGGHLAMELFKAMAGTNLLHVPYKSAGEVMPSLLAGRVSLMFTSSGTVLPHVKAGKLKAIAVTSKKRLASLPELPTVDESGIPGYEVTGWYGVVAPARTPAAVIERLNSEIVRIVQEPEIDKRLSNLGVIPTTSTPRELANVILADSAKWARVIKQAGIRAD